jgi:hypothetical protein
MRRDSRNRTGTRGAADAIERARHRGASYPLMGDVELREKGPDGDASGGASLGHGIYLRRFDPG